jgi:hypothetical protein
MRKIFHYFNLILAGASAAFFVYLGNQSSVANPGGFGVAMIFAAAVMAVTSYVITFVADGDDLFFAVALPVYVASIAAQVLVGIHYIPLAEW